MKCEEFGELVFSYEDEFRFSPYSGVGGSGSQGGCGGSGGCGGGGGCSGGSGGCGGCANSVTADQSIESE
jgi:hypothetical protein